MTSIEINREVLSTYRGRLMRKLDASAFKIAVCLGPTERIGDKMRIAVWSDNSRCWSNPQTRPLSKLAEIDPATLTRGQNRSIAHALESISANTGAGNESGIVKCGRLGVYVGTPWLSKAGSRAVPAGVTKLAPVSYSAASKRQVRELNKLLGGK